MKFASVNGVTLHYQQSGGSGVPLVFINSLGTDLRIWDDTADRLMSRFPVIRYDKRGHGLSDTPPAPYSMPELAAELIGLLDHLGVERAVLIGVSVGGMVALQAALDAPERVAALVLMDTAAKIGTEDYWNGRIETLRQGGLVSVAESIIPLWLTASLIEQNPPIYRGYYNLLARTPLEGYIGTCAALRDADLRERMGEISVPALVMCGAADVALTPETARELADSLPNARFRLIEQAAHLPSIEQPQIVADEIVAFLEGIPL